MDQKNSLNQEMMIEDLIKMLDQGTAGGVGHVNVAYSQQAEQAKQVQTMGCPDCSTNPMACSVPTLHAGLDRDE